MAELPLLFVRMTFPPQAPLHAKDVKPAAQREQGEQKKKHDYD